MTAGTSLFSQVLDPGPGAILDADSVQAAAAKLSACAEIAVHIASRRGGLMTAGTFLYSGSRYYPEDAPLFVEYFPLEGGPKANRHQPRPVPSTFTCHGIFPAPPPHLTCTSAAPPLHLPCHLRRCAPPSAAAARNSSSCSRSASSASPRATPAGSPLPQRATCTHCATPH